MGHIGLEVSGTAGYRNKTTNFLEWIFLISVLQKLWERSCRRHRLWHEFLHTPHLTTDDTPHNRVGGFERLEELQRNRAPKSFGTALQVTKARTKN